MGRASEIAKEIEIYEGLLDYAEVKNDQQKKEDIENKIKTLKSSLIATARDLSTDDFSRKDQSDLTFIRSQLSEIQTFEGGSFEVTNNFIARCQKVYDLMVKSKPKLEREFVIDVKSRCSVHVAHRLSSTHKSWESLRSELFANFSGGITAIQSLQRALNTPYDKRKGFKQLATQISLNLEAAKATIEKSLKKKEIKQEPGASSAGGIDLTSPMTTETLMEHLGASIMATVIQVHHNDLYNSMAPIWKKISNAGMLAEQAEYYQTQRSGSVASSYYGRQQNYRGRNRNKNGDAQKSDDESQNSKEEPNKTGNWKSGGGQNNNRPNRFNNNKKQFSKNKAYVGKEETEDRDDNAEQNNSSDDEPKETMFTTNGRFELFQRADATCYASDPVSLHYSTHHSFNSTKIQPRVDTRLRIGKIASANLNALVDTGSSISMISKKQVPPSLAKYVKPYNANVAGIGRGKLTGFIVTDLEIGATLLPKVKIYIIENDIPTLLGRDVIFDRTDFKFLPDTIGLQMIEKASGTVKSIVPYSVDGRVPAIPKKRSNRLGYNN